MTDKATDPVATAITLVVGFLFLTLTTTLLWYFWSSQRRTPAQTLPLFIRLFNWHILPAQSIFAVYGVYQAISLEQIEFAKRAVERMRKSLDEFNVGLLDTLLLAKTNQWDLAKLQVEQLSKLDISGEEHEQIQYLLRLIEQRSFNQLSQHPFYTDWSKQSAKFRQFLLIIIPVAIVGIVAPMVLTAFDIKISSSLIFDIAVTTIALIMAVFITMFVRYLISIKRRGFPASLPFRIKLSRFRLIPPGSWYTVVGIYYAILHGEHKFARESLTSFARLTQDRSTVTLFNILLEASQGHWDFAEKELSDLADANKGIDPDQANQLKNIIDRQSFEELANHPAFTKDMVGKFERSLDKTWKHGPIFVVTILILIIIAILSYAMLQSAQ